MSTEEVRELTSDNRILNEEIDMLQDKIKELEKENSSLKEEKNDLDDKIEELESKIEELEDELSESYGLDKIEIELDRLDTYWRAKFNEDELNLLPLLKQKIINIFLYG